MKKSVLKISLAIGIMICGLYGHSGAVVLERGPYVQDLKPGEATIVWVTDVSTDSLVSYGLTPSYTDSDYDPTAVTQHAVTLTGLSEGVLYHYQVGSSGETLTGDLQFHAGKGASYDSFTFVAFGDSRTDATAHRSVALRIKAIDPELIIHSGDFCTNGENASEWDPQFFTPEEDVICRSCFFPSIGNHEGNAVNYLAYFYLPDAGSGSERYYSFDYANAHFIALDTTINYSSGSPQYSWLQSDLIANQSKEWIFVYFHHPPYSSASHGSDLTVRAQLCPLFEAYGVDIVFNGHDHDYERGFVNGVYYIVTGGGGAPLHTNGSNWWTIFSASEYHCCKIVVNGTTLESEATKPDGTVIDSFSIPAAGVWDWDLYC